MSKLEIKLGKLKLKNPVILASGTFDKSIAKKTDINELGGLVTKTITIEPRAGNPLPHIVKTKYGWLNSVGLKNPGIDEYLKSDLPFWQQFDICIIASIGGNTIDEYKKLAKMLNGKVDAIEVNVSCPNVDHGSLAFGTDPTILAKLIRQVRQQFSGTLIIKLTPNVTNITLIAAAALDAGADVLSLTNTVSGLVIDNKKKSTILHRKVGGYSGSAIKPISLRMVYEVYKKLKCPIIGGGGIESFDDALDFLMVGAGAISIGSANFLNPKLSVNIVNDLEKYLDREKTTLTKIRGIIK